MMPYGEKDTGGAKGVTQRGALRETLPRLQISKQLLRGNILNSLPVLSREVLTGKSGYLPGYPSLQASNVKCPWKPFLSLLSLRAKLLLLEVSNVIFEQVTPECFSVARSVF